MLCKQLKSIHLAPRKLSSMIHLFWLFFISTKGYCCKIAWNMSGIRFFCLENLCFPLAVYSRKCNCNFKSELKKKWNYPFQIWFQTVNVYHPQSDCYVERYNDRFSISVPRFQNGVVILLKIWMHGQLNDFEILGY